MAAIPPSSPFLSINTNTEVLVNFKHGKPDNKEPFSLPDNRTRVAQSAQKGGSCWTYGLKTIQNTHGGRIGKIPSANCIHARELELNLSSRNKIFRQILEKKKFLIEIQTKPASAPFGNKAFLANSLGITARSIEVKKKELQEVRSKVGNAPNLELEGLEGGLKRFEDFYQFLSGFYRSDFNDIESYYYSLFNKFDINFLKKYSIDPEDFYKSDREQAPAAHPKTWQELTEKERHGHLDNIIFRVYYDKAGFKVAPWHPSQPAKALLEDLRVHGMKFVNGKFDHAAYSEKPEEITRVGEYPIFGWKDETSRKQIVPEAQSAVIVGMKLDEKIDENSQVFYISPRDGSDPANRLKQKVYVMSLSTLRKSLSDLKSFYYYERLDSPNIVLNQKSHYSLYKP